MDKERNRRALKFIVLVFFIGFSFFVEAQPKAGDFMLGGSLSFSRQRGQLPTDPTKGTETKSFFRLAPQVGIFLSKRWQAGFYSVVEYKGETFNRIFQDTLGRTINIEEKGFKLDFEFGFYVQHLYPIRPRLYWVNGIQPSWGTSATGDQLAGLFETDKPQQNREQFISASWVTQLQYFVKPNLSVSFGINPVNYRYTYNTIVRSNVGDAKERGHKFEFNNVATGLFIGVNLLIISEDEE